MSGVRKKAPRARSWRIHAPGCGRGALASWRRSRHARRQPPALGVPYTLRMYISHTTAKAVPPTAIPITAATKAAYEKSITAFMAALL
jgi:hypothetical protein